MWIDVNEELPRAELDVLVFLPGCIDGEIHTAFIDKENGEWYTTLECTQLADEVTHWQPLPSAPSERKPKPQTARTCGTCKNWERGSCNLPRSPRFTDTTSATDGCTPNKKARADWI